MANDNQILMYQSDDGDIRVEVLYEGETVWLTQAQMGELFQTDQSGIARHIKNIYETGELTAESTMQKMHNAQSTKPVQYYNLDVIISVGYRVNSRRGTQFRIWASQQLRSLIVKGFVLNDDRLANGGSNYFDELVERVRRIRTSEINFYKKVRSIFATAIDYDSDSEVAKTFFATVQNKFHYAITGHTAAEIIVERISSGKFNWGSGLTATRHQFLVSFVFLNNILQIKYIGPTSKNQFGILLDLSCEFLYYTNRHLATRPLDVAQALPQVPTWGFSMKPKTA